MKRVIFSFMLILLIGCNNDKKTVDTFTRRILKVNLLTTSSNVNTYYLNSLDDSLRLIKSDLNTLKLQQANKDILTILIDSVSENIHVARVANCIKGNKYTRTSKYKDKDLMEAGGKDDFFLGMLSTGTLEETVIIKNNSECEIIYQINDVVGLFNAAFLLGTGTDKRNKRSNETYKYIGNDEFQISNGWIIKVTDPQKCEVELLTDSEIKKGQQKKIDASSKNVNTSQSNEKQTSQQQTPSKLDALMTKYNVSPSKTAYGDDILRIDRYPGGGIILYLDSPTGGRLQSISDPSKTGTWSIDQLDENVKKLHKEQATELTSTQPADISLQKQASPQSSGRPKLTYHRCEGTYTLGCLNTVDIAQVQRCLGLTSDRYPRGSGCFDYDLQDKLSAMGFKNGFTEADVDKICHMEATSTKPFKIE